MAERYIAKYEFADTHEEDTAAIAAKELIVTNFETEHQTLLKQRESLFDFLEQGIYTKEIFIERSNALEQRIRDCMNNITAAVKICIPQSQDRQTGRILCRSARIY